MFWQLKKKLYKSKIVWHPILSNFCQVIVMLSPPEAWYCSVVSTFFLTSILYIKTFHCFFHVIYYKFEEFSLWKLLMMGMAPLKKIAFRTHTRLLMCIMRYEKECDVAAAPKLEQNFNACQLSSPKFRFSNSGCENSLEDFLDYKVTTWAGNHLHLITAFSYSLSTKTLNRKDLFVIASSLALLWTL